MTSSLDQLTDEIREVALLVHSAQERAEDREIVKNAHLAVERLSQRYRELSPPWLRGRARRHRAQARPPRDRPAPAGFDAAPHRRHRLASTPVTRPAPVPPRSRSVGSRGFRGVAKIPSAEPSPPHCAWAARSTRGAAPAMASRPITSSPWSDAAAQAGGVPGLWRHGMVFAPLPRARARPT